MTSSESLAMLRGEALACRRGGRLIFHHLSLALRPGDALLLLGPNGSGKSSLLRLLAGLLRPDSGALEWNGASLAQDREAHAGRLHYVGHHDAVKPVLSVAENLLFWARLHDPAAGRAQIDAALDALSLTALAELPVQILSAGQRRRLALARLLAAPAPLWLLDEPSVGLDAASVGKFEAMIARHRAGGGIIVLSTHIPLDLPGATQLQLDQFAPKPGESRAIPAELWG